MIHTIVAPKISETFGGLSYLLVSSFLFFCSELCKEQDNHPDNLVSLCH